MSFSQNHSTVEYLLNCISLIEVKSGRVKGLGGSLVFKQRYPEALSIIVCSASCKPEDFLLDQVSICAA